MQRGEKEEESRNRNQKKTSFSLSSCFMIHGMLLLCLDVKWGM